MSPLWSARFRKAAKARIRAFGWEHGEHSIVPDPDDLRALGKRLDEVRRQNEPRREEAPPTSLGIASRFATEFVVAVAFGGGLGWALDRWLGTRPIFLLVLFVLGAAAGMRNVMRAAAKINAEQAASQKDDKEI
jgi:ATP synthase protein I